MSELTFVAAPRISAGQFARVLLRAGSPAAEQAETLYGICVDYGLDPAIALAFFAHESTYGKFGVARRSLNWGNLRRGARAYAHLGGFAYYHDWADSLRDWCELILGRYVGRGLATVERAIPVYAPSSDGNAPARYVAFIRRVVAAWEASEHAGVGHAGPPVQSRVVAVEVANVRSAPELGNNIVGKKYRGQPVGGLLVEGGAVGGDARWLKLGERRYMHVSVLR
jgi:hypothetical protein